MFGKAFGETKPENIIDRTFRFDWKWLGSTTAIIGKITGIDFISENEMYVAVTNSTFSGLKLAHLRYVDGCWEAVTCGVEIYETIPDAAVHRGDMVLL